MYPRAGQVQTGNCLRASDCVGAVHRDPSLQAMKLEPADVTIVHFCARTGRSLASRARLASAISYCISEEGSRQLVVGRDEKEQTEFEVAGGVKVLSRLASSEGKATLTIMRRNINLMIRAEPAKLVRWLQALAHPPAPQKRPLGPMTPGRANEAGSPTPGVKKGREPNSSPSQRATPPGPPQLSPHAQASMTSEQQRVLLDVLSGHSVFFTGGAGVGKSHLLGEIVKRLPADTTHVTATTGIAACAVGGMTVHSWAGIGGGGGTVADLASQALRRRGLQWRAAKVLVIDEVSMLDGALFDLLEAIARAVRGDERPFGGLQLVLCGDFFQV